MKKIFKRFLPYYKEYYFYFGIVLIGILLTVTSTAATAYIMQPMMDDMFINKEEDMLYIIPLILISIYITKGIGRYLQSAFTSFIGLSIVTTLREELLGKMLHFDMDFIHSNRSGEFISRITNDINRIQYFVSNMLPELIREALSVVALVGYVIWLNPMLSFYAFVVLPIVIYPLIRIAKRLKKLSKRSQEKSADVMTRLSEIFNNSEIIKANATEKFELKKFEVENQHFLKLTMKAVYTGEVVSPMLEIIGATGLAAVIFFGAQEVYTDKMTVGEFFSFFTAVGLALQPLRRIGSIYGKIQDAVAASERVFELMDKQLNIIDGTQELTQTIQNIEFKKVALNYNNKPALENINLTISSGKTIALVGDSGGGKSSLINLLIRFYDVSSGNLEINHHDIKSFTQKSLREHIAIVSQRVYIFNDTLAANVAYGHEINEEKVLHALKLANATEFVQSLYEGMHTMMEEFGSNLSGGQRQRIAIARAIYKDASVLILDEATSALDNRSEKEIQNALEEFAKNKITIIIAHRLSTIEHADEILVFKSGEIVDRGSHIELTQSSKAYQKLLQGLE